ncbi:MAG: amidohydrolase [Pseudomonadota bacterium]
MLSKLFRPQKPQRTSDRDQAVVPYDGPVDLLFDGATLVTVNEGDEIIADGAIAIADGTIVAIGPAADLKTLCARADIVVDAHGKIVMPGLINTHCHGGDSLFRGLVEGLALEPWLEKLWVAESGTLDPARTRLGSTLGYGENLLCGVTTVMDMFWYPEHLVAAADETGIRVATGPLFFDPPGIDGHQSTEREALAKAFFDQFADHQSLIKTVCAHGAYTVSAESLTVAQMIQDDNDALLTIHAAETRAEQKTVMDHYGRSVINHLDELGLLSARTVLAHCVHVDEEEIDLLAASRATVSHNPASNLKLGSGIAPIPAMRDKGVHIGLGTDGAVSGNDLDMWKSIRLAAILHNGATENPVAMGAGEVIRMATINGALALGVADETGSLEVGKRADILLMDPRQAHAVPVFDPLNYLVYSASHQDVCDVYVAGRQVVKDRVLTTIDLASVMSDVNALIPTIEATLTEAKTS